MKNGIISLLFISVVFGVTFYIIKQYKKQPKKEVISEIPNKYDVFKKENNLLDLDSIDSDTKTIFLQKTLINKRIPIKFITSFNVFEKDSTLYLIGLLFDKHFKFVHAKIKDQETANIIASKEGRLSIGLLVTEIIPSFELNVRGEKRESEDGYYIEEVEDFETTSTVKGEIIAILP